MKTSARLLVEQFYYEVWNNADEAVAREILHPDFQFRASLGPETHGLDGFLDYMRSIHTALARYECIIQDLIESDSRAAARMQFKGGHRGSFFGVPATGREIVWIGAAFFTIDRGLITKLWVLGDIDAIKEQLTEGQSSSSVE
jgi:steroid delta-isomerase-like uncharacterized protein